MSPSLRWGEEGVVPVNRISFPGWSTRHRRVESRPSGQMACEGDEGALVAPLYGRTVPSQKKDTDVLLHHDPLGSSRQSLPIPQK